MLYEIRTATITSKGQISIPAEVRKDAFKEGEKVTILAFDDKIVIKPFSKVKEAMSTAYASEKTLAKDWISKEEEEAWKDL